MHRMNDPFFSDDDKSTIKATFVSSLTQGIRAAAFIAPVVLVLSVGTILVNMFSRK